MLRATSRPRRSRLWIGFGLIACIVAAGLTYLLFDFLRPAGLSLISPKGSRPDAVLYVSGDLGLRFGNGPYIVRALTARGYPLVALSSPGPFGHWRSREEVDQIVAGAVRGALARTHAERLVLIGQSFGADILQTGLATLPEELREKVAAVVLVVPGRTVYFRADPSGFAYRGAPDSDGRATARTIDWAPLTCIYGRKETDSLCPTLDGANVQRVALPGGHFLGRDYPRVVATLLKVLP